VHRNLGGRRRRPRRQRRATFQGQLVPTLGTSSAPQPLLQRLHRQRRRRGGGIPTQSLPTGEVILQRSERLDDVSAVCVDKAVHPFSFPWLAGLVKAFDLYRWPSVTVEYRPLVGTTTAGAMSICFVWSSRTTSVVVGVTVAATASTRDGILACTPCMDGRVWQRAITLSLSTSHLCQVNWYNQTKSTYNTTYPCWWQKITSFLVINVTNPSR